jgi:hypothetical protein
MFSIRVLRRPENQTLRSRSSFFLFCLEVNRFDFSGGYFG